VCYSKQLVLGVEIIVEDFNFESQVLLMRTNLTLIDEKISPVRIQAVLLGLRPSQHLKLMLLEEVQDPNLSKTWKLPVFDGLEMRM